MEPINFVFENASSLTFVGLLFLLWAISPVARISNFVMPLALIFIIFPFNKGSMVVSSPQLTQPSAMTLSVIQLGGLIFIFLLSRIVSTWISQLILQPVHLSLPFEFKKILKSHGSLQVVVSAIIFLSLIRSPVFWNLLGGANENLAGNMLELISYFSFLLLLLLTPFLLASVLLQLLVAVASSVYPRIRIHPATSIIQGIGMLLAFYFVIPEISHYLETLV